MRPGVRQPQLAQPDMLIAVFQCSTGEPCNRIDTFANFKSWLTAQSWGEYS